jgi:hypothetical protein
MKMFTLRTRVDEISRQTKLGNAAKNEWVPALEPANDLPGVGTGHHESVNPFLLRIFRSFGLSDINYFRVRADLVQEACIDKAVMKDQVRLAQVS